MKELIYVLSLLQELENEQRKFDYMNFHSSGVIFTLKHKVQKKIDAITEQSLAEAGYF